MKLFGHPLSPYFRVAQSAAEIEKVDYEFALVDMMKNELKSEWFTKVSI